MNEEMKKAISQRLNSDQWDSLISKNVLRKKRKRNSAIISSTAAVAALLMVAFIFTVNPQNEKNNTDQNTLNSFISKQIEGTYKEAVTVNAKTKSMDIDSLINDSITERGI
jgi:hypothetical protein